MYQPLHFKEDRREVQHELIRAHPLGLLVSHGAQGLLADHVPFVVDDNGGNGRLRCHVARANPHWQQLDAVTECLIVFQGPQAYVTPSWYPTKHETGKVVPTWNYVTVHCWGTPRVVQDAGWIRAQIEAMTNQRETERSSPWAVGDAPDSFIAAQIRSIVGIEIDISRIEGKWKVSQNRTERDRVGVRDGMQAEGQAEMAAFVAERGSASDRPR